MGYLGDTYIYMYCVLYRKGNMRARISGAGDFLIGTNGNVWRLNVLASLPAKHTVIRTMYKHAYYFVYMLMHVNLHVYVRIGTYACACTYTIYVDNARAL